MPSLDRILSSLTVLVLLTGVATVEAQQAAARNLIANPGFESSFRRENPWDGVNQAGFLEGQRFAAPVLTAAGTIGETSMPVSVAVADMNGDGRQDIIMSDVLGYIRVYFNEGTPQEPKFGVGELVPVFLTNARTANDPAYMYRVQRIAVADLARSGKSDFILGNYMGEIMLLRNQGTGPQPVFRQPNNVNQIIIPTTKQPRRWGNVFSPAIWDFDRDGKPDLLIGEGSYSANNIHLLLNKGSAASPTFTEEDRHVLAFGDGREQLTPAVVDYNGNGRPDLLVADRSGKIGVYLNESPSWKPGDELPFASYISGGGREMAFGGISTVAVGDLTGNGLFDLVVGKSNGRVALALNKGTKEEPKFDAPVELKGTSTLPALQLPSAWEVDYGLTQGNFLGFATVVDIESDPASAPPEGKKALKFGYFPNFNKVFQPQFPTFQGFINPTEARTPSWNNLARSPSNYFMMRQEGRIRFAVGKTYVLTFKVKGTRVTNAAATIRYSGFKQLGESRIERGERGSAQVRRNEVREEKEETVNINAGAAWTEVKKEFKVDFLDAELKSLPQTTTASITIGFSLPPGAGELYFDDFVLYEK